MAGRRAKVRYWASRGTWTDAEGQTHKGGYFCEIKGRQHTLAAGPDDFPNGPTYQAAHRRFWDLYALDNAGRAGDQNTPRVVIEMYLRHLEATAAPKTLRIRKMLLQAFCKEPMADEPVSLLTPHLVRQWLAEKRRPRTVNYTSRGSPRTRVYAWDDGQERFALTSLQAALNFGVKEKLITANPLKGLSSPPARSRGRDAEIGRAACRERGEDQ